MQLVPSLRKAALTALGTFALPHQSCPLPVVLLVVQEAYQVTCSFDKILSFCIGLPTVCNGGPAAWGPPPCAPLAVHTLLPQHQQFWTGSQVLQPRAGFSVWSRLVQEGEPPQPCSPLWSWAKKFQEAHSSSIPAVPWKSTAYTHVSLP